MIIFRPHRGSLYAAMAEAKEFSDVDEMKEYIVKTWHEGWFGESDLFTADDIPPPERSFIIRSMIFTAMTSPPTM